MAETMHPTWSSDAALDEAFANWVPGQLDDLAPATPDLTVEPTVSIDEPADERPSQLDELLGQLATVGSDPEPEPEPLGLWSRADDDILPRRRRGLRRRR